MLNRRIIIGFCGSLALGILAMSNSTVAQEKAAKELVVGTWTLSIADHVRSYGGKVPGFGPLPSGTATFGSDGHYSVQIKRSTPAPASITTVGVGQGGASETVSHSGTYAIDESQKTLTFHIEQSSLPFLPSWAGTTQVQPIKFLIADDFGWTSPKALTPSPDFAGTELVWRRAK
jgi:hypothetical protein